MKITRTVVAAALATPLLSLAALAGPAPATAEDDSTAVLLDQLERTRADLRRMEARWEAERDYADCLKVANRGLRLLARDTRPGPGGAVFSQDVYVPDCRR